MYNNITNIFYNIKRGDILKRKKLIIIIVSIIAVLLIVVALSLGLKSNKQVVKTEAVKTGQLQKTASLTGEVISENNYSTMLNPSLKVTSLNFKVGDTVKKGDVILSYDSSDIKTQLEKAKLNLKYQKEMLSEIESQNKDTENLPKEALSALGTGNQKVSTKSQELQIDIAENDIDALEKKLDALKVISPISGKITKLNADKDSMPTQGAVLEINDTSKLKVKLNLSQYDSELIKTGQKVSINISGISTPLEGEVSFVSSVAESTSATSNDKTIVADVSLKGDLSSVKIGFEAECLITLSEKECNYVSFDSIKKDNSGTYILVIENNSVKKKYIKTGIETDFDIEIVSGLKAGERYIKNPSDTLKEGSPIKEDPTKGEKNE